MQSVRQTIMRPAMNAVRALRLLLYPSRTRQLYDMGLLGSSFLNGDPTLFIKRKHYLSRFLPLRQRIDNMLLHYRHEQRHFDAVYHSRVYRENGLVLWTDCVGDVRVSLRLVTSGEHRCEGDVSVVLEVNGRDTADTAYSFVDAGSFGLPHGTTMFVTRIQLRVGSRRELDLFRHCYAHSSPQYFCLAALAGIAMANDIRSIAVIRSEAQICYQPQYDLGFRNSYCNFWHQFGARPIDAQACMLDVPLSLPPLASVVPKHRARAAKRRQHWAAITQQVEATVRAHRLQTAPATVSKAYVYACEGLAATPLLVELAEFI
jgi:hypothetical protein